MIDHAPKKTETIKRMNTTLIFTRFKEHFLSFHLRGQFKKHDLIAFKEGPTTDTAKRDRHATKSQSLLGEKW